MKIIITGGNGYIGSRLSRSLAMEGHKVIPICYPSVPADKNWLSDMADVLVGDLRNNDTINEIAKLNADIIIHLVSLDHFESEKEPGFVNSVNVLPTWCLLDACTKAGLKKFIYFSTIQVYGKLYDRIITENQSINTSNVYGLTHHLSEQICSHFNRISDTNVISIRLSNSYGAPIFHDANCWWLVVNDLCRGIFKNNEIRLKSDGSPLRDFIHGNDITEAVKCLINTNNKLIDNVYHISSGNTYSIMELAQIIKSLYKVRYNRELDIITPNGIVEVLENKNKNEKYIISNNKIKTIGFSTSYSISQGVNELFTYLENNKI